MEVDTPSMLNTTKYIDQTNNLFSYIGSLAPYYMASVRD